MAWGQDYLTRVMPEFNRNYAKKVPKEIRLSVEGLAGQDDLRFGVVMALIENEGLSFSQLRDELEVHQQSLSTALTSLKKGGLVKKLAGETIGGERTGTYHVPEYGRQVLDGLYHATRPKYEDRRPSQEFVEVENIRGAKVRTYDATVSERSKVGNTEIKQEKPDSFTNTSKNGPSGVLS